MPKFDKSQLTALGGLWQPFFIPPSALSLYTSLSPLVLVLLPPSSDPLPPHFLHLPSPSSSFTTTSSSTSSFLRLPTFSHRFCLVFHPFALPSRPPLLLPPPQKLGDPFADRCEHPPRRILSQSCSRAPSLSASQRHALLRRGLKRQHGDMHGYGVGHIWKEHGPVPPRRRPVAKVPRREQPRHAWSTTPCRSSSDAFRLNVIAY